VVSEPEYRGLTLPDAVARAMLDHAGAELPNEACGLVSGTLETGLAVAYHPARNSEHSPLRYNVHPDDLLRITLEIEAAGRDLVGIFHSHTRTPAVPSATDLRAAMYSEPLYILATLADPDAAPEDSMRAWRIRDGQSAEVSLSISGGNQPLAAPPP
jgi:[CysO sulfur-carrier protein]-S-L-cysteine hydrolase